MNPAVAALLREAEQSVPAHEARELLAYAIGMHSVGYGPAAVLAWDAPDAVDGARFREFVAWRAAGTPLQYITGVAVFRTVEVGVGPGVFIPRPETEVMTGWAIDRLHELDAPVVVELCAGSGAISLAIATEAPGCVQYAVERDAAAYAYACRNLASSGVHVVHGDMADALHELDATVDLVIANPPYVAQLDAENLPADVRDHEPEVALFSGPAGLDAIRVVAAVAGRLLRPGGWLACEHGDDQGVSAPSALDATGAFDQIADHLDLTGRARFVTARRLSSTRPSHGCDGGDGSRPGRSSGRMTSCG